MSVLYLFSDDAKPYSPERPCQHLTASHPDPSPPAGGCASARRARYLHAMSVRRSTVVALALAFALGGGAVAVAAPGALAGSNQAPIGVQTHPSVRPRVGRGHSRFELTFTLAQAPGRAGLVDTHYSELVSPPAHAVPACSPTQPAPVATGSPGATIKIHLHPPTHGWCNGRYKVTVFPGFTRRSAGHPSRSRRSLSAPCLRTPGRHFPSAGSTPARPTSPFARRQPFASSCLAARSRAPPGVRTARLRGRRTRNGAHGAADRGDAAGTPSSRARDPATPALSSAAPQPGELHAGATYCQVV